MRKSSLVSILLIAGLVVGLAGGVAFAVPSENNDFGVTLSHQGFVRVIDNPGDLTLNIEDPGSEKTITEDANGNAYSIKVVGNINWGLMSANVSTGENTPSEVADAFAVKYDVNNDGEGWADSLSGESNGAEEIDLKFIWNPDNLPNGGSDFAELEAGDYNLTVTLTVQSSSA